MMGMTTTWTCDHCGHSQEEQDTPRQTWWVGLSIDGREHVRKLWCRECLVKWSMTKFTEKEDHPEKVEAPTFEDKLREIIREEIWYNDQGGI